MKTIQSFIKQKYFTKNTVMVCVMLLLSACSTTSNEPELTKPIAVVNYNAAFEQCKITGDQMALSAAKTQSQPQYLNAAKIYRACSEKAKPSARVDNNVSMKLYVLSTINFIKGGELTLANEMVERFRLRFPQKDYYFANYTSFLDTVEALLKFEQTNPQLLATLNISAELRKELLRKDYWLKN